MNRKPLACLWLASSSGFTPDPEADLENDDGMLTFPAEGGQNSSFHLTHVCIRHRDLGFLVSPLAGLVQAKSAISSDISESTRALDLSGEKNRRARGKIGGT